MNHTVGSHSDDRGGDSDLPCYCEERIEHNSSDPETTTDTTSLPNLPPKDRDSLDSILEKWLEEARYWGDVQGQSMFHPVNGREPYTLDETTELLTKELLAWHRHLSTKEMLEARIDELEKQPHFDNDQFVYIKNRIAAIRAALTREEN